MNRALWVAAAYLAGTLPSPYLVALGAGRRDVIDRMRRSESPGDAHFLVTKLVSKSLGIASIVLDILKGVIPAVLARMTTDNDATVAMVGIAAAAGHCYPPYLRRAGGRGLTTVAGVSLIAVPWAMAASGAISLAGTLRGKGGSGTSLGFGLLPVFSLAIGYRGALVAMSVALLLLIWLRRLEGIANDTREGVGIGDALIGRLLFDLPGGRRD